MMVNIIYSSVDVPEAEREFHSLSAAQEWIQSVGSDFFWSLYAEMYVLNSKTGDEDLIELDGYEEIMNYGKD